MNKEFKLIKCGGVTSPKGYAAGAVKAKIKNSDKFDLGILYSEATGVAAGVFTTNKIKSAPVIVSRKHLKSKKVQAIVVNSGCANACTGDTGLSDAEEMTSLAAQKLNVKPKNVIVASTGVIGVNLPMDKISSGIREIKVSPSGGADFARAIMTTDKFSKEIALSVRTDRGEFTIGGVAKGAGMIHPDMATMLCFITTDAAIEAGFLKATLVKAVGESFNMITVDGDTSPSDTVVLMANGVAEVSISKNEDGELFQEALNEVCIFLAKSIARDGEGATKLIEIIVEGAYSQTDAKNAARTVAGSSLVKSAIHGNDPNWGRIVAALGRSKVKMDERKLDVWLHNTQVMRNGDPQNFDKSELSARMAESKEISIKVSLNQGRARAIAWGCDLSEEYVTINSDYTT